MIVLTAIREAQIPLVAALMVGACLAKLVRATRTRSVVDGLGPTALFPLRLRRPLALTFFAIEGGLGAGLIVTADSGGPPATCIRLGCGLMFLVATSALVELRATRPDVGCGCFGDFSTAPVSGRTLARSALLSGAALSTIGLPALGQLKLGTDVVRLVVVAAVELIVLAALSPELGEGLVRLGYSEPCELRALSTERTLAALRRSKQWRRHASVITSELPTDVWRELCWRYAVFPARSHDRDTEVVFAIFLQQRRPTIHAAVVDTATAQPLAWHVAPPRPGDSDRRTARQVAPRLTPGWLATPPAPAHSDMPFSSDL